MTFTPLIDFWSDEFQSNYCKGLFYTVRNAKLAALADKWKNEGKIAFVDRPKAAGLNLRSGMSGAAGSLAVGKDS